MAWYNWSKTASSNATADPSINWAEGQAPSSVNDSARAMMARTAEYRDDISGATVTGGTSTSYTLSTFSGFDTVAHLDKQLIAFTPHTTNGQQAIMSVDGLGPFNIRTAPGVVIPAGVLVQGTPYVALFSNADSSLYLQNFYGNPYNIPLGAGLDYWGSTTPNSNFAFSAGQAISRTTYASLFSIFSTTYGVGDGSTTFNLPDKVGRASVMRDPGGIRITGATFSSTDLGGIGGVERVTLIASQIPTITSTNTSSVGLNVTTSQKVLNGPNQGSSAAGGTQVTAADSGSGGNLSLLGSTGNIAIGAISSTSNNTGSSPVPNVQPSLVSNYIIRII